MLPSPEDPGTRYQTSLVGVPFTKNEFIISQLEKFVICVDTCALVVHVNATSNAGLPRSDSRTSINEANAGGRVSISSMGRAGGSGRTPSSRPGSRRGSTNHLNDDHNGTERDSSSLAPSFSPESVPGLQMSTAALSSLLCWFSFGCIFFRFNIFHLSSSGPFVSQPSSFRLVISNRRLGRKASGQTTGLFQEL